MDDFRLISYNLVAAYYATYVWPGILIQYEIAKSKSIVEGLSLTTFLSRGKSDFPSWCKFLNAIYTDEDFMKRVYQLSDEPALLLERYYEDVKVFTKGKAA